MRLVFIGASVFGKRCLEACLKIPDVKVVGVVTAEKRFSISYNPRGVTNVLHTDIAAFAKSHSVPTAAISRNMNDSGLLEKVMRWRPTIFLVAGWYHIVPKIWREIAPAYGLHASLLPDYSGGAPLVWAMINGEKKTGITLFQMDDNVDSGPIAGQKEEQILPKDTIATLYARIEERGVELVLEALPRIATGDFQLRNQDQAMRRVMPQRTPEDGWIDWNQNAVAIDRFIRAQTRPYPGAYSMLQGKPLHIWRSEPNFCRNPTAMPGQIRLDSKGDFIVSCGKGELKVCDISYDGAKYNISQIGDLVKGGEFLISQKKDS